MVLALYVQHLAHLGVELVVSSEYDHIVWGELRVYTSVRAVTIGLEYGLPLAHSEGKALACCNQGFHMNSRLHAFTDR